MKPIESQVFICIDCETTGLDPIQDKVIEVAVMKFTHNEVLEQFETLIDPEMIIPPSSIEFHNITDEMVKGKPKIADVLDTIIKIIGNLPIVGHSVKFDIEMLALAGDNAKYPHSLRLNKVIDTLRLARLYGESPVNSLEQLRKHFNVPEEGAHRAMSDVIVNTQVFRHLSTKFKSLDHILTVLERPILMKTMPLGKHKGRLIKDLPIDYLKWAAHKDFDMDLLFSLRQEITRRKKGGLFTQAANPFTDL